MAWVGIGSIFVIDLVTFVIGIVAVVSVPFGVPIDHEAAATTAGEAVGLLVAVPVVGWSVAGSMVVAGAVVAVLGGTVALAPWLRLLNHVPTTAPTMSGRAGD